jgi:hypothetical protein
MDGVHAQLPEVTARKKDIGSLARAYWRVSAAKRRREMVFHATSEKENKEERRTLFGCVWMSGLNVFTSGKRLVNIARGQLHDRTRSFDSTGRPIAVASRERGGETLTKLSAQLSEATTTQRTNASIQQGNDDDNAMDGSVMGCHTRCFLPHRSTRKHGPSISSSPPRPA